MDGQGRCALLNESLFSPERGATSDERQPTSVGVADLTDTRLFWIVVMSALSGTCLVLLTVAVAVLMRRVCCYVDVSRDRRHHRHQQRQRQQQQQAERGAGHQSTSRRRRVSGDCSCRQTSPPMQLPLVDVDQTNDSQSPSAVCDSTEV